MNELKFTPRDRLPDNDVHRDKVIWQEFLTEVGYGTQLIIVAVPNKFAREDGEHICTNCVFDKNNYGGCSVGNIPCSEIVWMDRIEYLSKRLTK